MSRRPAYKALASAVLIVYAVLAGRELARHSRAEHRANHPQTGGPR